MTLSHLAARVQGRYQRSAARFLFKRPFVINSQVPLISFTFDDFPRSALLTGGAILKRFGLSGTYYASFGLMGKKASTDLMFLAEDIAAVLEQGHELGCHTFAHCHSWETKATVFERSVVDNALALDRLFPGVSFRTFSYPISPPRPQTKRTMANYFTCCRGGGQTFNVGTTDLSYLSACFIEQSRDVYAASPAMDQRIPRIKPLLAALLEDPALKQACTKWPNLKSFADRVAERPAVKAALEAESAQS